MQRAREHGATTILNPAPVSRFNATDVLGILPMVDVVIPNELEAEILCAAAIENASVPSCPEQLARKLRDAGARSVIITLGESGCLLSALRESDASPRSLPSRAVGSVVDTTAAGDCFCGAIAEEIASGASIEEACEFATLASGICVTRDGAQPSIPRRSEVLERVSPR